MHIALALLCFVSVVSYAQTVLVNPSVEGGFELPGGFSSNGWTSVSSATNQWYVGAPGFNTGTNGAYISNDLGVTNNYTNTTTQVSHFYRDITFPAGETIIYLNFNFRSGGESIYDYIRVYLVSTATTPVAGTLLASGQLGGNYNLQPAFTGVTLQIPASNAGTTQRLVFTWRNDGTSGTMPAGSIDDISVVSQAPAPLNGIYTIDNTLPTSGTIPVSGGNFNSFNAAVSYMNIHGISGPVTFNVASGQTFSEAPQTITTTGTLANPIIFQKNGAGANPVFSGTGGAGTVDAAFAINGADYITFDGIDVLDNPSNATTTAKMEYGYFVKNASATDGAKFITIKNCTITLDRTNTNTYGVYQNVSTTPTNATGSNSNNLYDNVTIQNSYRGIHLNGNSSFWDDLCEIRNCNIGSVTANDIGGGTTATQSFGIRSTNSSNIKIHHNRIKNVGVSTTVDGILVETTYGIAEVYNNKVSDIRNTGTSSTSGVTGIRVNVAATGTHSIRVYNNFVSAITSAYTGTASAVRVIRGIYVQSAGSGAATSVHNVDFNSVSIDASSSLNVSSTCFEIGTASGPIMNVRNNIFANYTGAQTGAAKHYTWRTTSSTLTGNTGSVSNFNDLYIADATNGFIGLANTTDYATLGDWQGGLGQDGNSMSSDPLFVNNASDLHATAPDLNLAGNSSGITWVTDDIDGEVRGGTPDIGADEFVPPTCFQPTSLGANPVTSSSATFTWTPGASETSWDVYYGPSPLAAPNAGTTPTATAISNPYIALGLSQTTNYSYYVRSNCGLGDVSFWAGPYNFTTPESCVTPTALTLTPASPTSANMTWTCTGCTGSFIVEYGAVGFVPGTGATAGAGTVVAASPSPFLLIGLTANTTYDVYVRQDCGGTYSSNAGPVKYIPGDICENAIDLATLTSPYSGTTTGAGSDFTNTCASGNASQDLVFSLVVPPYYSLDIGQTVNGYDSEITLFYGGSCPGTTQIACFDDPDVQNITWINNTGTTQTVYWVQDGYSSTPTSGTFTLAWNLTPPVYDINALNLASPAATGCYTNAETVSVTIRNDGTAPIDYSVTPVTVSGAATGTNPQIFTPVVLNTGTLAVGATQVVNLSTAYDMSAGGTYTFDATATFTGDALITNDTMPTTTRLKTNPVVTASNDTTICIGSSAQLMANVTPNAPSGVFTNTNDFSVPDNTATGTSSVITVNGVAGAASSVMSVRVNLVHTFDGDLDISLIAPNLSTIDLSSDNGSSGDNYTNTVFVPTGAPSITTGVAPMTGNYTPEQPFSNLTGAANGNWTLKVADDASGDVGTLLDWTITFNNPEGIASYSWSPATGLTSTTIANPVATPTVNTTYTVVVTDNSGCSSTDSVAITVSPLPVAPTASNTSVCSGNAATLTASGAGTLGWYTASTGGTYLGGGSTYITGAVTVDTTFFVRDSSSLGCVSSSTPVLVTITPNPTAPSAVSTAICANDSILLSATGAGVLGWYDAPTAGNYLAGGSSYQTPVLMTTTLYYVQDSNSTTGCVSPRTIVTVTVNANPLADLGADTTQCAGTVLLDAGAGAVDYLWNDNSIAQTLTATISGTYSVTITDTITGCFSSDAIQVTINSLPTVSLGVDSVQCGGSIVLDAGNVGASYLWSDNTSAQTLSASASGQYYVTVTDANNCSASDSVNITINALPVVDLGNDSTQCGGGIVLDAGTDGTDYLWNDNTTAQTLTAFVTGQYYVTVTDSVTGCFATDSINVTLNQYPIVDLGADTTQCAGTVVLNASNAGASFLWNDNTTAQTLTVSASGQYSVAVTLSGCTTNDTIDVTINPLPLVGLSPFTTPICNDLTSFVLTNGSPAGGVYSGANVTGNTFNAVAAGVGVHPITYTVTDTNGCSNSSSQNLTVQNCTGVEEYVSYEAIVYPNPTSGAFTLSIKNANIEELIISVVDIQGKEVFGVRERSITADYNKVINLENVSKGMYYIKLSTGSDMKIQKLIVQ